MASISLNHGWEELLDGPEVTLGVDYHGLARVSLAHLEEQFALDEARVIDQDINRSELALRELGGLRDLLPIRQITLKYLNVVLNLGGIFGLGALALGHPLRLLKALFIHVNDGKLCTSLSESDRDQSSET